MITIRSLICRLLGHKWRRLRKQERIAQVKAEVLQGGSGFLVYRRLIPFRTKSAEHIVHEGVIPTIEQPTSVDVKIAPQYRRCDRCGVTRIAVRRKTKEQA